jgi:type I restriction enzyme, S subunit
MLSPNVVRSLADLEIGDAMTASGLPMSGNLRAFDMVNEWENTTLGEVVFAGDGLIQTGPFGSQLHASDYVADGVPVIMPVNISDNRVDVTDIARITQDDAIRLSKHLVRQDDIIYSRRGDVTRKALIRATESGMFCGTGCLLLRPGSKVDARFLTYHLGTPENQEWIIRHAVGATMPNLNTKIMEQIPLRLPAMDTQRAIARILGTLDDKIELNREMNETLEGMAQALFKSWFVDFDPVIDNALAAGHTIPEPLQRRAAARQKLSHQQPSLPHHLKNLFPDRFYETKELGWVPDYMMVRPMSACCEKIHSGGTPSRANQTYWDRGDVPWLTSGEVRQTIITKTANFITERGLLSSAAKWVAEGATVIALYGATAGQVSYLAVHATTNQAVCAMVPLAEFRFFNYFVMRGAISDLERKAVGSAQQNISKKIVEETKALVPTTDQLKEFNRVVQPMFEVWIHNMQQNVALAHLRDTLLPRLLSGKLRIPDAEKIIAEVV